MSTHVIHRVLIHISLPILLLVCFLSELPYHADGSSAVPSAPILRVDPGMHTAAIRQIAVDTANRFLVTCSDDKTVRVWDAHSGKLLNTLRVPEGDGDEGQVDAVAISADGTTIACGGWTGYEWDNSDCVYLFDRAAGTIVRRMTGLPDIVNGLAFSPDGRFLAAGCGSGGIRVYSVENGAQVGIDKNYGDSCYGIDFARANGKIHLVSTCYDGSLRLYSVNDDGMLTLATKANAPDGSRPCGVRFSPDGNSIAVGYDDKPVVSIVSSADLSPEPSPACTNLSGGNLGSVAWSKDGSHLYAGGEFGTVQTSPILTWDDGGHGSMTVLPGSGNTILSLQTRADGGVFYAAFDPSFGFLDQSGSQTVLQASPSADFRNLATAFGLSLDGSTVAYAYREGDDLPATFSLQGRQVGPAGISGLASPTVTAAAVDVQNWKSAEHPTVNGIPLALQHYERSLSLAIVPDAQSFVLGADWHLYRFDKSGKPIWTEPIPGVAWSVNVSGNGRVVTAALGDGTIRWYRVSDGQELLAFYPHPDQKRWVVWSPSGYYDCSPGGEDLIGWVVNHGKDKASDFFPASRFRSVYYRPDVVSRLLSAQDESIALRQADDDAGRTPQSGNLIEKLPPVVTILSPQPGASVAQDTVTIKYSLRSPSGEPVTDVKVLIDGRPLNTQRNIILTTAHTATPTGAVQEATVTIPHRDCAVSVIAANRYASSEAATVNLVWNGTQPSGFTIKPNLYVLAVGISKYDNPEFTLDYPAKDAHDFAAAMLKQKGGLYQDVQEEVLTDGDASKDAISDGLDWIEHQTTQHDVAMVFLSGHGANDQDGNYLFIPANFSRDHVKSTGLSFEDIKETVENLPGKTLFFIDSCHSGNVMGTDKTRAVDIVGAVNELSSAENGAIVFAASTGNQVAQESQEWGNGAFTKALVEAISGKADYNHDGKITVNMLDLYISDRVKELTQGTQTPTTTKPETVPDFPIAIAEK